MKIKVFLFSLILFSCGNISQKTNLVNNTDSVSFPVPKVVLAKYLKYDSLIDGCNREISVLLSYNKDKYNLIIKGKPAYMSSTDSIKNAATDSCFQIKVIRIFKVLPNNQQTEIKFQEDSGSFYVSNLSVHDYDNASVDSILKADIMFSDENLDGFPDLSLLYDHGTGGYIYYTWLYKPSKSKYEIEPALSEYNNERIDTINKTITTWWRNDYDITEYYVYKIEGEKLIPFQRFDEILQADSSGEEKYIKKEMPFESPN